MKKTVEHNHTHHLGVWTDDQLIAHVTSQHDVPLGSYMLNESNRTLLAQRHAQAHHGDPIRL